MRVRLESTLEQENAPLIANDAVWIGMLITNQTEFTVSVTNPDVGKPPDELNWSFANETFQIAVLLSLHLMEILVTDSGGEILPQVGPHPWVSSLLMPRLEMGPGDCFKLRIKLNDHFQLRTGRHHLTVKYGDHGAFAQAETELVIAD